MTDLLAQIRKLNGLGTHAVAEPFAGGAGASLSLLYLEETKKIFINDADPAIYDFWWSLVSKPERFLDYLSNAKVTIEEWHLQRGIYKNPGCVSRVSQRVCYVLSQSMQPFGHHREGWSDRRHEPERKVED